jgi:hypothetical protein
MNTIKKVGIVGALAIVCLLAGADMANARGGRGGGGGGGGGRGGGGGGRGGGGARPSMGHVGGGGGRSSVGGAGGGRAGGSHQQAARPNFNKPSMGHASGSGGAARPNIGSHGSGGGFSASGGGRPNFSQSAARPGGAALVASTEQRPTGEQTIAAERWTGRRQPTDDAPWFNRRSGRRQSTGGRCESSRFRRRKSTELRERESSIDTSWFARSTRHRGQSPWLWWRRRTVSTGR